MHPPRNITPLEARTLLQLANRLHMNRDPVSRKRDLIAGICQLVDGSAGSCIVTHVDPQTSKETLVSATEYHLDDPLSQALAPVPAVTHSSAAREPWIPTGAGATLHSSLNLRDSTVSAALVIFRYPLRRGQFTARHRLLVDLFHAEMTWVYQADVLLTSPSAQSLSPRARQTLQYLLAGLSEKQVASRLHLSPNTVHHYVKVIHKHFGVSSRSELLARWVGK